MVNIEIRGPSDKEEKNAHELAALSHDVTLSDDEDYATCSGLLKEIREKVKVITAQKDSIVKPINEALKNLRALYKPTLDSLTAAECGIKAAMLAYREAQERARMEADERARELLAEGRHDEAVAQIRTASDLPVKAAGSSVRKTWQYRVVDANAVPREFLVINESRLRAHARESDWQNPPPGIEYYQVEGIAIR